MGGGLSTGISNDELVEYLLSSRYISKKKVELVFKSVDRANYVLSTHQETAYRDHVWKHGNLHLSAPCVYGVSMEFLPLRPGKSFLNIGSGTGYFSTMAGFLLGAYGTNHGIEVHEDCIRYAYDRLEEFKRHSKAIEEFDFCEPTFFKGNCLRVEPTREYDVVYCGAAVSENHIAAIKRFVRVGGTVMVPYKGSLCCLTRTAKNNWRCKRILEVSFAMLAIPNATDQTSIVLPGDEPLSLQELCRYRVRQILRLSIWREHPELAKRNLDSECQDPEEDKLKVDDSKENDDDPEQINNEEEDHDHMRHSDTEEEEDDDETDVDFIGQMQVLFNMEVSNSEFKCKRLRRYARFAQWGNTADRHCARAQAIRLKKESLLTNQHLPHRSISQVYNDGANSSGQDGTSGTSRTQNIDISPNVTLDFSAHESQDERQFRIIYEGKPDDAEACEIDVDNDTESSSDSESKSESNCESEEELPPQMMNVVKEENIDRADHDVNAICEDTRSSSTTCCHSDTTSNSMTGSIFESFGRHEITYTEGDRFVEYMREKIQQLPLPDILKLYINYNRTL